MSTLRSLSDVIGANSNPHKAVGIEIEVEFDNRVNFNAIGMEWIVDHDGSLRNHGYELKSRLPVNVDSIDKHLTAPLAIINANNPIKTSRTSIHVHVNCLHLNMIQILNALTLAWIVEPYLFKLCAKHRLHSRFCLPINRSPILVKEMRKLVNNGQEGFILQQEMFKYAGVAYHNLYTIGTLEFRMLDGRYDKEFLVKWVDLLQQIVYNVADYKNPQQVIEAIFNTPGTSIKESIEKNILKNIFEDFVTDEGSMAESNFDLVSTLIYSIDWEYLEKTLKEKGDKKKRTKKVVPPLNAVDPAVVQWVLAQPRPAR